MDKDRFQKPLVVTTLVASIGLGSIEVDTLLGEHDGLLNYPQSGSITAVVLPREHEPHDHPDTSSEWVDAASPIIVTGAGLPSQTQLLAWPARTALVIT